MTNERTFPLEFESRKPVLHYPDEPKEVTGDILEIGPGRGDLLLWLAQQYPEKRLIGIEMMLRRYRKLIKRVERLGLTNVRLLRGNARVAVPRYFTAPTFERVYVLFPDPWPKARHAFHRLLSVEFLGQLSALLKPGGEIALATDHQPYAAWVIENVAAVPSLANVGDPYSHDLSLIPNPGGTFFQQLWQNRGRQIYQVQIRKLGSPSQ